MLNLFLLPCSAALGLLQAGRELFFSVRECTLQPEEP
jgi:hypothetical protein